jgi:hypothetical protein
VDSTGATLGSVYCLVGVKGTLYAGTNKGMWSWNGSSWSLVGGSNGRDYLVVLTIWDSAGQSDSKAVSYQAEPGSLKASNSVVNAPAVPAFRK